MIKELHIAAQYLSAAAISFVEAKQDDSHTNFAWLEGSTLFSRALGNPKYKLALNFSSFSIEWYADQVFIASIDLAETNHLVIINWIKERIKEAGYKKEYSYKFHYNIGYEIEMQDYTFPVPNQKELNRIAELFSSANEVLHQVLKEQSLYSEIRVWPHHFDMGAYTVLNEEVSVGMGLAIPDHIIPDFYYYIRGYQGENTIPTENLNSLVDGEWQTGEMEAGILKASGANDFMTIQFFNAAINAFRNA